MSEFQEYPKMLYRPAKGEGEMIWGERVDITIVPSYKKEFEAIKEGWLLDPEKACAISAKMKKRALFIAWLASHWKVWLGSIIGIAGVVATIISSNNPH